MNLCLKISETAHKVIRAITYFLIFLAFIDTRNALPKKLEVRITLFCVLGVTVIRCPIFDCVDFIFMASFQLYPILGSVGGLVFYLCIEYNGWLDLFGEWDEKTRIPLFCLRILRYMKLIMSRLRRYVLDRIMSLTESLVQTYFET